MDTVICCSTKGSFFDSILYKTTIKEVHCSIYFEENNLGSKGLSEFYNECIEKSKNSTEIENIVFCHDDVQIINTDFIDQVKKGLERFDVLGIAGCLNPKIKEKNLWHWMSEREDHRGIAGHPYNENKKDSFYVTSFGPTPSRVAVIDGVFIAAKLKRLIETNTRFDEQFTYHHYDIDFSLQCNKNHLKIGVWPILINHQSPGLKDFNNVWNKSNTNFINKWKNK
jgi:hypothetical protein